MLRETELKQLSSFGERWKHATVYSLADIQHVQKMLEITPDVLEKRKLDRLHRSQKFAEKRKKMEEVWNNTLNPLLVNRRESSRTRD